MFQILVVLLVFSICISHSESSTVSLYGTLSNRIYHKSAKYNNPFADVTLHANITHPNHQQSEWYGFYNGGNTWMIRWMPTDPGVWSVTWKFSDHSASGNFSFSCINDGKHLGVLRGYKPNPRWFAYQGDTPVWLKSYYLGHATLSALDWSKKALYEPLMKRGYNHFQLLLLPLYRLNEEWADGEDTYNSMLVTGNSPTRNMNLTVLNRIEEHLFYLNENNVNLLMFQGFDGKRDYKSINWRELSETQRSWYVRYLCSRFCPLASVGWQFTWETDGEKWPLQWASLMKKFDPWDHLRTAECEDPTKCDFNKPDTPYSFEAVENHIHMNKHPSFIHGVESHYNATILGYNGKNPIYVMEGNGLWHTGWGASQPDIRRNQWAVALAGGSYTWQWLTACCQQRPLSTNLMVGPAASCFNYVDVLTDVMTNQLDNFHTMNPRQDLLRRVHQVTGQTFSNGSLPVYCLASDTAYLVGVLSEANPITFELNISTRSAVGFQKYWIDVSNGHHTAIPQKLTHGWNPFTTPANVSTNFVLFVQRNS